MCTDFESSIKEDVLSLFPDFDFDCYVFDKNHKIRQVEVNGKSVIEKTILYFDKDKYYRIDVEKGNVNARRTYNNYDDLFIDLIDPFVEKQSVKFAQLNSKNGRGFKEKYEEQKKIFSNKISDVLSKRRAS